MLVPGANLACLDQPKAKAATATPVVKNCALSTLTLDIFQKTAKKNLEN